MTARVMHGDCRDILAGMADESVDAAVTDPPYEIAFMGRKWDGSGIAFDAVVWREVLRVLKPGGHIVAFGSDRTVHRLMCAIEDAGFDIRSLGVWVSAQCFPKSLSVEKATGSAQWSGWGTALKTMEPWVLARKPLGKGRTIAACVLEHGTGALNINACRLPFAGDSLDCEPTARGWLGGNSQEAGLIDFGPGGKRRVSQPNAAGRWPSAVIVDDLDIDGPARGVVVEGEGSVPWGTPTPGARDSNDVYGRGLVPGVHVTDHAIVNGILGPYTRHFRIPSCDDPTLIVCPKASTREREAGLEHMPERYVDEDRAEGSAGRKAKRRCTHTTVKPVALMRHLVRLVTPPGGLVLDPFCGSGSTGVAAVWEGFNFVGCELNDDEAHPYVTIARARIAHAAMVGAPELKTRAPGAPEDDERQVPLGFAVGER